MRDLGTLGGPSSQAWSINESGEVSGAATLSPSSGETHAAIWEQGFWIDVGVNLGPNISSVGYGMNDKGQLVGNAWGLADGNQFHPFLWSPTRCR